MRGHQEPLLRLAAREAFDEMAERNRRESQFRRTGWQHATGYGARRTATAGLEIRTAEDPGYVQRLLDVGRDGFGRVIAGRQNQAASGLPISSRRSPRVSPLVERLFGNTNIRRPMPCRPSLPDRQR